MRKLLLIMICAWSCNKPSPDSVASMSYKLNGKEFSSIPTIKKIPGNGAIKTMFVLQNSTASITIIADVLEEKKYLLIYGSFPAFIDGDDIYSIADNPDHYLEVTITSVKDGYVSGTFKGNLICIETQNEKPVIDGKFLNVKLQ